MRMNDHTMFIPDMQSENPVDFEKGPFSKSTGMGSILEMVTLPFD